MWWSGTLRIVLCFHCFVLLYWFRTEDMQEAVSRLEVHTYCAMLQIKSVFYTPYYYIEILHAHKHSKKLVHTHSCTQYVSFSCVVNNIPLAHVPSPECTGVPIQKCFLCPSSPSSLEVLQHNLRPVIITSSTLELQ